MLGTCSYHWSDCLDLLFNILPKSPSPSGQICSYFMSKNFDTSTYNCLTIRFMIFYFSLILHFLWFSSKLLFLKLLLLFSSLDMSDSLQLHGVQHARPPCPSPTPGVYSDSCPLSRWCHPTISFSVAPSPPAFRLSQHQGLF